MTANNWISRILCLLLTCSLASLPACGDDDDGGDGTTDIDTDTDTDSDSDTDSDTDTDTDSDTDSDTDTDTDSDSDSDGGIDSGTSEGLSFGENCDKNEDCASNICHSFTQLGDVCTVSCTKDTVEQDCPLGSNGEKKCNNHGVCRP